MRSALDWAESGLGPFLSGMLGEGSALMEFGNVCFG